MQNIYFCICKTICFAQVYVFAYAKVYTLYKTYSFAYAKYIVLRMYMVLHAALSPSKTFMKLMKHVLKDQLKVAKITMSLRWRLSQSPHVTLPPLMDNETVITWGYYIPDVRSNVIGSGKSEIPHRHVVLRGINICLFVCLNFLLFFLKIVRTIFLGFECRLSKIYV